MYHYLTGAASWYMLTLVTEVFGIRGEYGDLVICPRLVREQFGKRGTASVELSFAGKQFRVTFANLTGGDFGEYRLGKAYLSRSDAARMHRLELTDGKAVLERSTIQTLPETGNAIMIELM